MTLKRPMLAAAIKDPKDLCYPLYASPKLDGIRTILLNGKALSRSLKPIPNKHVRAKLEALKYYDLDGELMVDGTFQDVTSAIMTHEGKPKFVYHVFDCFYDLEASFTERLTELRLRAAKLPRFVKVVPQTMVFDVEDLMALEAEALDQGYEGLILRDPQAPYKEGRSTLKQQWLLKMKRFQDSEAKIIGFEEKMQNTNKAKRNKLGYLERSSAKAGKKGLSTLGTLLVQDLHTNVKFRVGTGLGLDDELRREIWGHRKIYKGKIIRYKHQPHGKKDRPRLPVFIGFRDESDL